jgi:hypothetical protein
MKGGFHVRFSGEGVTGMSLHYPTIPITHPPYMSISRTDPFTAVVQREHNQFPKTQYAVPPNKKQHYLPTAYLKYFSGDQSACNPQSSVSRHQDERSDYCYGT